MSEKRQGIQDTLTSFYTGLGDLSKDKTAGLTYHERQLSDQNLIAAYRDSWLARKIVDIPALDALRKGRDWQASQQQITAIEAEETRLGFWGKLLQCKILARLWGGAAMIIGTKDPDLSQPLDVTRITKGGLAYLTVLSRRQLVAKELDQDPLSEFFGRPKMYEVSSNNDFIHLHPSRVVLQIGAPHPDPWNLNGSNYGWGDSALQSVYTAMAHADSTAANLANLVFEANVDVFGVPQLMENFATEEYSQRLIKRFVLAQAGKSVTRALVRDLEEEYTRHQISFAALPEVMQQFLLMVSGAADIPLTRLLGQSPAGLSTTGEGDMKNYYDRINAIQSLEIQPAIWRLDEAIIRSALGTRPSEIYYQWAPLEQISEKDQAEIGLKQAQAAEAFMRAGLFTPEELRKTVSNQLIESGFYPGLDKAMKVLELKNEA